MGDWRAALERFTAELRDLYGQRLDSIILYGSRARGEGGPESDVDTLIVLNPLGDFWEEFGRISPIASRVSLDYDVVISAIPAGLKEYSEAGSPLILNVRREGMRVS